MEPGELRRMRGRRLAMVFQDPTTTLNPVLTIAEQMRLALTAHEKLSAAALRARCDRGADHRRAFRTPARRLDAYPHQFSGGMRQRVAIAIALLHRPPLIVADEPTTALDVSIQAQILTEMKSLVGEIGTSLIWISHDLATVSSLADRIAGDVRGPHRRGRADGGGPAQPAPSVYAGPARFAARAHRAGPRAGADPGIDAVAAESAGGLPVRAALRPRRCRLQRANPASSATRCASLRCHHPLGTREVVRHERAADPGR